MKMDSWFRVSDAEERERFTERGSPLLHEGPPLTQQMVMCLLEVASGVANGRPGRNFRSF